jgi:hypothetical protein
MLEVMLMRVSRVKLPTFLRAKAKWLSLSTLALVVVGWLVYSASSHTSSVARRTTPTPESSKSVTAFGNATKVSCRLLPLEAPPPGARVEFDTDFSKHCVHYNEILSGGPIRDGIPAITAPKFIRVAVADAWLKPAEPVIFFQVGNDARAYPIQILIWHEIVNDTVGGVPVAITFCPLCDTAIAYERIVYGQVLSFGTTGRLRFSNLIMYDQQTESWWQQATGEAIIGQLAGTQLAARPAAIISWAAFKAAYPGGQVLSRDTGFDRPYGANPYPGYDDINSSPFLYQGPPLPSTLPPLARVLAVSLGGSVVAYPFATLQRVRVINDIVGGVNIVILWAAGTASPLDGNTTADGRDIGSAAAYLRTLTGSPGQLLTFSYDGASIVDQQTGSQWNGLGKATGGKLRGQMLTPITAVNAFWFAWVSFQPKTRVYGT